MTTAIIPTLSATDTLRSIWQQQQPQFQFASQKPQDMWQTSPLKHAIV